MNFGRASGGSAERDFERFFNSGVPQLSPQEQVAVRILKNASLTPDPSFRRQNIEWERLQAALHVNLHRFSFECKGFCKVASGTDARGRVFFCDHVGKGVHFP